MRLRGHNQARIVVFYHGMCIVLCFYPDFRAIEIPAVATANVFALKILLNDAFQQTITMSVYILKRHININQRRGVL